MNAAVSAAGSGTALPPGAADGGQPGGAADASTAAAATKCSKVAHAPNAATSAAGHVSFIAVPDDCRAQRAKERRRWREPLYDLPVGELFELQGRPHACWCLRSYGDESFGSAANGAKCAREDFGFLFKAFESGQTPPHRLKKDSNVEHALTIHQYLDWTITATSPADAEDLDFGGFRTVMLFSRHKPEYPPPGAYDDAPPPSVGGLGGPLPPLPKLIAKGTKPVSVATVRVGDNYLEVPFFATADNHRGKGYGRCLLEAIESIARTLRLPLLLLCSTDDDKVRSMWSACGFEYTTEEDIRRWNVCQGDLIYMTNTVQMHKHVPAKRPFCSMLLVHGAFQTRMYAPQDVPRGLATQLLQDCEEARARKKPPSKQPSKNGQVSGSVTARPDKALERSGSVATSVGTAGQ